MTAMVLHGNVYVPCRECLLRTVVEKAADTILKGTAPTTKSVAQQRLEDLFRTKGFDPEELPDYRMGWVLRHDLRKYLVSWYSYITERYEAAWAVAEDRDQAAMYARRHHCCNSVLVHHKNKVPNNETYKKLVADANNRPVLWPKEEQELI